MIKVFISKLKKLHKEKQERDKKMYDFYSQCIYYQNDMIRMIG